jgi:plastocyanin
VSDGSRPVAVKGGIKSGLQRNSGSFSHEFQIPGCYQFVSQGHNPSVVLDITVIEKPPKNVKLSDDGFSPRYLEVQLGETVTWTWNECFRPQAVQRVCFNSKEGTFFDSSADRDYVAPSLSGSYSYTFNFPGIYYFETEASYVSSTTHLCIVKVNNSAREHRIDIFDNGFKPSLLCVTEGDSVWWHWDRRKACFLN